MRLENCPRTSTILGDFSYVSLEVVKKKKLALHTVLFFSIAGSTNSTKKI